MLFFKFLTAVLLVPLAASAVPIGGDPNGPKAKALITDDSGAVAGLPTQTSSIVSSLSSITKACKRSASDRGGDYYSYSGDDDYGYTSGSGCCCCCR